MNLFFRAAAFFQHPSGKLLFIAVVFSGLIVEFRHPAPHWMDAGGYTQAALEGKTVSHPPGYWGFLFLIRNLSPLVGGAFPAMQAVSFFATLGSIGVMFAVFRSLAPSLAVWLAAAYAFSWIPLLTSTIGTPHPIDLLSSALMLRVLTLPGFWRGNPSKVMAFSAVLVFAGFFRLTTVLMWAPLILFVLFHLRRCLFLWTGLALAGIFLAVIQMISIDAYGGWEIYRDFAAQLNRGNSQSSMLRAGLNEQTFLNLGRALLWFLLSAGCFLWGWKNLPLLLKKNAAREERICSIAVGLAILGPLLVLLFYLAPHPGYLCVLVPPFYGLAALLSHHMTAASFRIMAAGNILFTFSLFFFLSPYASPATPAQAVANGIVLQYTRSAIRSGTFKTVSMWLYDAGYTQWLPASRLEKVEELKEKNVRE
jgi:hypothetical protein